MKFNATRLILHTTFEMNAFVDDLFTEEFPHYDQSLPKAVQMAIMILDHNPYKLESVLKNTDKEYAPYFIQAALQSHRLTQIRLRIILNTVPLARLVRLDETAYLKYPHTYLEMLGPERADIKAILYKKRAF